MVLILDKKTIEKKLRRIAFEILENNSGEKEIFLAGIFDSGMGIARTIQRMLAEISAIRTELITISLDKKSPREVILSKDIALNGKIIIVVDDVSNSGKVLLYALKPFLQFHPKKIQTLVLVERTHKAFPVKPDYVGLSVATTLQEHIYVESAGDDVFAVWLK